METRRSAFGTLLRHHRLRQGLSQKALAQRISRLALSDPAYGDLGMLSEKSIANLEAPVSDDRPPIAPRPATVSILAATLALAPVSDDYAAFVQAAEQTRAGAARSRVIQGERRPDRAPTGASPGAFPARFVLAGREPEMARLHAAHDELRKGRGQLVFVMGDAGIGKSFLVQEACRQALVNVPKLRVLWAECSSFRGQGAPYQPFKQLLSILTGDVTASGGTRLIGEDNQQRILALAKSAIVEAIDVTPELIGPFIGGGGLRRRALEFGVAASSLRRLTQTVEDPPSDRARPDQLYEPVCQLLFAAARETPLIVVLDDLHWADESTLALLFYVSRRLHELQPLPLLLIGTIRPADLATPHASRHPLHQMLNEFTRYWGEITVDLAPTVGYSRGRLFIDGLLAGEHIALDGRLHEALLSRTEGHPLFTTEILNLLRLRRQLVRDDQGRWIAADGLTFDELPAKVGAIIAERVGRLAPDLARILSTASVQGATFIAEATADALDIDRHALLRRLDEDLVRQQRLLTPGEPMFLSGSILHRYSFTHVLFQDHLRSQLSPAEQSSYHATTAHAMARLVGDRPEEFAAEIGRHFEAGGLPGQAARYYHIAAEQAIQTVETRSALEWYRGALPLARSTGDQVRYASCLLGIANALRLQDCPAEAIDTLRDCLALCEAHGESATKATALLLLGWLHFDAGDFGEAARSLKTALPLARQALDRDSHCAIESLLSHIDFAAGRYDQALAHAQEATALARAIGSGRREAEALVACGNVLSDCGRYLEAIAHYQVAVDLAHGLGDLRGEAVGLLNLGLSQMELNPSADARDSVAAALEIGERIGRPRTQAAAHRYLGFLAEKLGHWEEARTEYRFSIRLREDLGPRAACADDMAGLLRAKLGTDVLPQMQTDLEELIALCTPANAAYMEQPTRVYLMVVRGLVALNDVPRARQLVAEGCRLLLGRAYHIADRALQRSFLEGVTFHHELLELGRALLGSDGMERLRERSNGMVTAPYV